MLICVISELPKTLKKNKILQNLTSLLNHVLEIRSFPLVVKTLLSIVAKYVHVAIYFCRQIK